MITSSTIVAMGGAYLSIGYTHSFTENMTNGRGFIGLAALIAGSWRPGRAFCFALLFGFFGALVARIQGYGYEPQVFVQALPYLVTLIVVTGVVGRSTHPHLLESLRQAVAARGGPTRAPGGRWPAGSCRSPRSRRGRPRPRAETGDAGRVVRLGPVRRAARLVAIVLARRARERIQITLGRAGGGKAAQAGRILGIVGLLVAGTAALALGFWGLLSMFAER